MNKPKLTVTTAAVLVAFLSISTSKAAITNNYVGQNDTTITENLDISSPAGMLTAGAEHGKFGIFGAGKKLEFLGNTNAISIDAREVRFPSYPNECPFVLGVESGAGSSIVIGGSDSSSSFDFKSKSWVIGLRAAGGVAGTPGGLLTLSGKVLNITAESEGTTDKDVVYALIAQNFTSNNADESQRAKVIVNAENTNIIAKSAVPGNASGLVLMSEGNMEINSNLFVEADKAIVARGGSVLNINEDGKHTTKLYGNIDFNYDKETSGTVADANVHINFSGKDSIWVGNSSTSYGSGKPGDNHYLVVNGLQISLQNGATWEPSVIQESTSSDGKSGVAYIPLNLLTLNDATISIKDASQTVRVQNLGGSGGTLNIAAKTEDGKTLTTGHFEVSQLKEGESPNLNIALVGVNADNITDAQKAVESAKGAVTGEASASINKKIEIAEGAVNGAITADVTGNEVGTVSQTENTKLSALNSVTAMGTMAWRHDMNDLTKRMGELRTSPEGIGSWVRLYGSEQEYGRQDVTTKSTSVQVGSDYDVGYGWKVGGAFTYTDGSSDYANGSSDNKAYGLAAYGSWLHEDGAFVDVIAKYSRLKSDFDMSVMSGTSKNNAYSASAEFGWYVPFANVAFVEPQAEITYGVVKGDDFTTSNGVAISQKDTKALIGRLGVRTGLHFNENKGVVYARASVLRDFKGESEFTASLVSDSSVCSTVKDDIGGTYYEMGIGANYKFADNAYTYVDFERQNGGDVKEKWRWNVGFRYVW